MQQTWASFIRLQSATLVTHHFFRAHIFFTKMLEYNILYDNLCFNILSVWWRQKNIGITHANHSATSKAILTKMHVHPEPQYFLFALCARHYPWRSFCQKNTNNNYFIQIKLLFSAVEFSNSVTFWRNSRFDVILTSIKHVFLRKLFCYESRVDIEVSKH